MHLTPFLHMQGESKGSVQNNICLGDTVPCRNWILQSLDAFKIQPTKINRSTLVKAKPWLLKCPFLLNSGSDCYSLSAASHTSHASHCPSMSRDCDLSSRMSGCWKNSVWVWEVYLRHRLASGVFLSTWELAISTEMFKRASFLLYLVGSCHPLLSRATFTFVRWFGS